VAGFCIFSIFYKGVMPLEVRFLHDPKAAAGFVGCALFGKVFKFFKKEDGQWDAKKGTIT
jgi:selenium-binding protein 1